MCSSCTPLDTPRRPQVGDLLDVPVGYETVVVRVHDHGVHVDVRDRLGRDFAVTRAPRGRWTRLARSSGRTGRGPCVDQWRRGRGADPARAATPEGVGPAPHLQCPVPGGSPVAPAALHVPPTARYPTRS